MSQEVFRFLMRLSGLAALVLTASMAQAVTLPSLDARLASLPADLTLQVAAVDSDKALNEDAQAPRDRPLRYALKRPVLAYANAQGKSNAGRWERLDAQRMIWRLPISAPGAISIDLGFSAMYLPHGAELYLASADGSMVLGPYTEQDNTVNGEFWTPVVGGAAAQLQLVVPNERQAQVRLTLAMVHSGYRDIWSGAAANAKSGSCNVDIACALADPYRDQARAVARYTTDGGTCTGELINNTRSDRRRLFMTAAHCVANASEAASAVVYWHYESPTCRTPRSTQSGIPIAFPGTSVAQTGGATLLARNADADTVLMELRSPIPSAATPYWYGWDRSEDIPAMGVVIHHANGDEKRISIDNNPLQLSDSSSSGAPGRFHWHLLDYEAGTTERGSSGSGLMNQNKRLIGVLSGGDAACFSGAPGTHDIDNDGDNDLDDYYGRLSKAWEGGGTPATRVRDYLDPDASGVSALDGRDTCTAPNLVLSGPVNGAAGTPMVFTVAASGGAGGPYRVEWDIDNDGVIDRSSSAIAASTSISPSYPTATSTSVVARVSDADGCTISRQLAINVSAPDLVATPGAMQQVCGNGDSKIDPGERWRVAVDMFNAGGTALDGGYAVFKQTTTAASLTPLGPDGFGYRAGDDSSGCNYQYIDLSPTVPALPLMAAYTNSSAEDEGATARINITPFQFYGDAYSSLMMSTNGYLVPNGNGGDFDNQCGLSVIDGEDIAVLHDDLVVDAQNGGLRHQFFSNCPRPAESTPFATACDVFQWSGMGQFVAGGPPDGNADFEAILYPSSGELVYQYKRPPADNGASATIGIRHVTFNGGNSFSVDGLPYACNRGNAVHANQAVCFFRPEKPPLVADLGFAAAAVPLGNLAAGQHLGVQAEFLVSKDAACGKPLGLGYVGTIDNKAFSMRSRAIANASVGSSCQSVTSCGFPNDIVAPPDLQDGLYANPNRYGNGIGSFVIKPPVSATPIYFGLWFTGEVNRNPTWYAIQGPINTTVFPIAGPQPQATAVLYRAELTSSAPFQVTLTPVGEALVTYLSATRYVFTWSLDGASGGELQSILYPGGRSHPNRTGAWYLPSESGWGEVIDDHLFGGSPEQVIMEFIYDADGKARWTLGASADINQGGMSQTTYRVHCPNCANFPDFFSLPLAAGTISRSFTDTTHGTLSTAIVYPAPLTGAWTRSPAVPIVPLTSPGPQ